MIDANFCSASKYLWWIFYLRVPMNIYKNSAMLLSTKHPPLLATLSLCYAPWALHTPSSCGYAALICTRKLLAPGCYSTWMLCVHPDATCTRTLRANPDAIRAPHLLRHLRTCQQSLFKIALMNWFLRLCRTFTGIYLILEYKVEKEMSSKFFK